MLVDPGLTQAGDCAFAHEPWNISRRQIEHRPDEVRIYDNPAIFKLDLHIKTPIIPALALDCSRSWKQTQSLVSAAYRRVTW